MKDESLESVVLRLSCEYRLQVKLFKYCTWYVYERTVLFKNKLNASICRPSEN